MRDASLDEFVDPEPSDGDVEGSEEDVDESEGNVDESEAAAEDGEPEAETEPEPGSEGPAATGDSGPDVDEAVEGIGSADTEGGDADQPPTPETVDPATPTLDFSPGGADCEGCGETVRRRWRDDDGMVCGDCKEW